VPGGARYPERVFGNIGWGEMMVLLVAALVILGPERLPGAVQWASKSLRQVRDYASGATAQLKDEFGTDFEDLRQPLSELNNLRGMTPRSAITKHLLDGDDSLFTGKFDKAAEQAGAPQVPTRRQKPLKANETPPIDPDAT
jgi:sec-independent protein translocase protein TatB